MKTGSEKIKKLKILIFFVSKITLDCLILHMNILKIYLVTSLIGGCFDKEFMVDSRKLINQIEKDLRMVLFLKSQKLK